MRSACSGQPLPHAYNGFRIDTSAADGCYAKFRPFVGIAYEDSIDDVGFITPTKVSWEQQNDREVLCLINNYDGTSKTGSARDARQ